MAGSPSGKPIPKGIGAPGRTHTGAPNPATLRLGGESSICIVRVYANLLLGIARHEIAAMVNHAMLRVGAQAGTARGSSAQASSCPSQGRASSQAFVNAGTVSNAAIVSGSPPAPRSAQR